MLFLEGQDGAAAPAEAGDLLSLLTTGVAPPALWFLGALGGGRRGPPENGALSIAQALVGGDGIQAAVAVRHALAGPVAVQAIERFYAGLLTHGAADVALNDARTVILDEWAKAAPVLVSRLPDCRILEVTP